MNSWGYFISGFQLIFKPGIKRFVVVPLLINILIFAGMLWLAGHEYHRLTQWLMHFLPSWLHWLSGILWILFVILAILLLAYLFTLLANLVAAPFNGFLAEKIEVLLRGEPLDSVGGWKEFLKDTPRLIKRQFHYIGYYLARVLAVVILLFIPGLQVLVTPAWYLLNSWMMAVQYVDYPMDNHKISFAEMRRLMAEQRSLNLGFGALVMLSSMVPILNFFIIPAAVAGATHLWVDHYTQLTDS